MQNHNLTTFTLSALNLFTKQLEPLNHGYIVSIPGESIISLNVFDGDNQFMFNLDPNQPQQVGNLVAYLIQCPFITRHWENPYEPVGTICQTLRKHVQAYPWQAS